MSATVVYEIACYKGHESDRVMQKRLQIITEDGTLLLRDAVGKKLPCKETDVASAIRSTPVLRKVPKHQEARITCSEEVFGQLPALFEAPLPDGASLFVNGKEWDSYPTVDDKKVMLPGLAEYDYHPEMNPCWAEYRCAEGGRDFQNQLVGFSSIGLLAPGIAIEHGRTEYGGNGGVIAVSITPFEDFAALFIEWLFCTPILSSLWHGDRYVTTPEADLFHDAASSPDHLGSWRDDESTDDEEEHREDQGEDADDEDDFFAEDEDCYASRDLELHLSPELIEEVRERLAGR